ncbi:MAG: hypothetical protein BGO86_07645 [Chryseobacterium sp. 36-9]|nr:MAG: hypothetical protein BGO86_07645 [Chryseobacterium sp. 36-9]
MDRFKYKDRGTEKFWLIVIVSSFINLNLSSIDNVFLGNYLHIHFKYIFFLLIPIIMFLVHYLFVKNERFLEYGFKESYKGYMILFLLFVLMIVLMAMVVPRKNYH